MTTNSNNSTEAYLLVKHRKIKVINSCLSMDGILQVCNVKSLCLKTLAIFRALARGIPIKTEKGLLLNNHNRNNRILKRIYMSFV